jgi:hypothetical protein
VTVPHPIGGIPEEAVVLKAPPIVARVVAAPAGTVSRADAPSLAGRAAPDDLDEFLGWIMERGFGDGLPAIPATAERARWWFPPSGRPAPSRGLSWPDTPVWRPGTCLNEGTVKN